MKGRMSWPALTIAAVAVSALAPSAVDAQQEQLFPNLWIQRQRVPPSQEKPLYGMYRNRYYGYFPTCWRRFPPGWGCPSPEVPDWEAEVERNPVDLGGFGPGEFDGMGAGGLGPAPDGGAGPAPGEEPLPELPDEGRSLFERDPFAPEPDDQPEPELRQPQEDPFESEPPDPFQNPFDDEPLDPFSPDAPQTSAPPAAPLVIPPLRDEDEAAEVGGRMPEEPPSLERDLAALPDLNTRPASRPPDVPPALPAVETTAPGDFVLPPPGAPEATQPPHDHHNHNHRIVPDMGRRLGSPLPEIVVSEPRPEPLRSQPDSIRSRSRVTTQPITDQRFETQPRRRGPIRQFFSGLFNRRVRR